MKKFPVLNYIFACSVQLSYSILSNSVNLWMAAWGFLVHHQLPELAQIHVHQVGDAIQPSQPLSSLSPSALNLSQSQGFSNESALLIRWPQYWSFSFNISPSNEHSGLISLRMDWWDLLAVQGVLKPSPESQLESINSSALSLPCGPTPTSVHDSWQHHSSDCSWCM